MGIPRSSDHTSLGRLKNLDSLTSIEAQIGEATKLCTHGARAEMILRWIVEKLRNSTETGTIGGAWNLAGLATRLLSPQRVAMLLGSTNFQAILLTIFSDSRFSRPTLIEIQQFFELLLQIGSAPNGASVKALMSADSIESSAFCGVWFSLALDDYSIINPKDPQPQRQVNLKVALDIWALRKRQPHDDTLFTQNCLFPVLWLLSVIQATSQPIVPKRRHHDITMQTQDHYQHLLRSLLATHCVLPARAAFRRERNTMPITSTNESDVPAGHVMNHIMNALRTAITKTKTSLIIAGIPLLLEITILSVPTPSPRHRDREQPWLEYFFSTLIEHVCSADLSRSIRNSIIAGLLDKFRQRGSLSSQTLVNLVRSYALKTSNTQEDNDLTLIIKVIEMNVDIFANASLAELLLDAVSAEAISNRDNLELKTLIRDSILIPIMAAFARGRALSKFVTLWKHQLSRHENNPIIGVWEQLSQPFATLLESSLSHEQVLEVYANVQSSVVDLVASQDVRALGQLDASLILLNAILCGVRSDELLDRLHNNLNNSIQALFHIAQIQGKEASLKLGAPYWTCLAKVFQLWFPLWSSHQLEHRNSYDEMRALVTNESFQAALALCTGIKTQGLDPSQAKMISEGAERYVATVCNVISAFGEREEVRSACAKVAETMMRTSSHGHHIFMMYPDLLVLLNPSSRRTVLAEMLTGAANLETGCQYGSITSRLRLASPDIKEEFITVLIERLRVKFTKGKIDQSYRSLIEQILATQADAFTQDQRRAVLDIISEPHSSLIKFWTSDDLQQYLALIQQLTQPASGSTPCLIYSPQLWMLAEIVNCKAISPLMDRHEHLELFEMIVWRVLRSWLNRQHDPETRHTIMEFIAEMKRQLENNDNDCVSAKPSMCIIVKVIVDIQDNARSAKLAQGLTLLDLETIHRYVSGQLEEASRHMCKIIDSSIIDKDIKWTSLPGTLENAISVSSCLSSRFIQAQQQLAKLSADIVNEFASTNAEPRITRSIVQCARLIGEVDYEVDDGLVQMYTKVLELSLTVSEHYLVISAYAKAFKRCNTGKKGEILDELSRWAGDPSVAHLSLLQTTISNLTKDDAEIDKDFNASRLLLHTTSLIAASESVQTAQYALAIINVILREKSFLVNQYCIEHTMSTLQTFLTDSRRTDAHYTEICQCVMLILVQYRSRVQDRLHLIINLLQALLSRLFLSPRSKDLVTSLSTRHATIFTRILVVLCNRRPEARHRNKTSELVDESRKVQARTGQYVQYILHRYCSLILTGSLGEDMREALMPGIWAVIEAIEVSGTQGMKALSAAMNNNERAVLRSVYDDWKRFGKWEGL